MRMVAVAVALALALPVWAAPVVTDSLGVARATVGQSLTRDLSAVFSGDGLVYSTSSADSAIARATLSGDSLLVEPRAAGKTIVQVTASDSADSATTTLTLFVQHDGAAWGDTTGLAGSWEFDLAGVGLFLVEVNDGVITQNTLVDSQVVQIERSTFSIVDSVLVGSSGLSVTYANGDAAGEIIADPAPVSLYAHGDSLYLLAARDTSASSTLSGLFAADADWLTFTRSARLTVAPPTVVVHTDHPLTATMPALDSAFVLNVDTTVTVDLAADPPAFLQVDGESLSYQISTVGAGVTASLDGHRLTFEATSAGRQNLLLVAADPQAGRDTLVVPLRVNAAPRATELPSTMPFRLAPGEEVILRPAEWFLDIDDAALSYTYTLDDTLSGSVVRNEVASVWFLPAQGVLRVRGNDSGTALFRLTATDPWQASLTLDIPVVVAGLAPGDFDGSGAVDFDDFFRLADVFGTADATVDLTGDGFVDFDDFFLFADHFGT
jgi:hypothetical protein